MIPFPLLFLLFLFIPLLEIYLLIKAGSVIGALPTVALVVFTAVLGAFLLRLQGLSTMNRIRANMAQGKIPAMEIMEGAALLVAGGLLLTPGFFTDAIGFLLLIPPLRRYLLLKIINRVTINSVSRHEGRGPRTFEGESWRDDDEDPRLR
ncbi:MAG TPA: hypothetical protein ENJ24_04440 [Gammaproteobacteria bacterium]|nr:hypothetical protein [Gammaproteobacteria bacterium]